MRRAISVVVWLLTAIVVAASLYLAATSADQADGTVADVAQAIAWSLLPAAFAVTAALIIGNQPENLVGWLLLVPALGYVSGVFVGEWLAPIESAPTDVTPGLLAAVAFDNFSWVLLIFPIFLLLLVFPTGRLLSPGWRWVVWLQIVMVLVMVIISVFPQPIAPFSGAWTVHNPIGWFPASVLETPFLTGWTLGLVVVTVAGLASMVVRYRRADPVEREQVKWLVLAVAIFAFVYSIEAITEGFAGQGWVEFFLAVSLTTIPVAIAIAVLRFRLFDIDRVITRTVGYTIVVLVLGSLYVAGAIWLPSLLGGEQPPVFVAGSTLAVAALFSPLRKRTLKQVDRWFYRSRYDPDAVVQTLSARLENETEVGRLADAWAAAVAVALQPASVGVWVRDEQPDR